MAEVQVVDPEAFRAAHEDFIREEEQATRLLDALAHKRRALPAALVETPSKFIFVDADGNTKTLFDLFEGRQQLIIFHFMFYGMDDEGCSGCSFAMDHVPQLSHLHSKDVTFAAIAPGPIGKMNAFKKRMGWQFPFYSSKLVHEEIEKTTWKRSSLKAGLAVFLKDGDRVLHTYSATGRGVEHPLLSTYGLLDLTPLGRGDDYMDWNLHDQY